MQPKANTPNVRAVKRALAILNSFAGKGLQSLGEVTSRTGLDKGTTRRLLLTLMESGYIAQDPASQHYKLGRAIRELLANVADELDIRAIALPIVNALAEELQVTVFISVYEDGAAICLDRVHGLKGIEVHWWSVGGTLPYNCGGAPKLLLAYQTQPEIERVLKLPMVALTSRSMKDTSLFCGHLLRIRNRGWECAIDDVSVGLTALAVPVRSKSGDIVCSLSIAGLTPQMVEGDRPIHLERLQSASRQIQTRLG